MKPARSRAMSRIATGRRKAPPTTLATLLRDIEHFGDRIVRPKTILAKLTFKALAKFVDHKRLAHAAHIGFGIASRRDCALRGNPPIVIRFRRSRAQRGRNRRSVRGGGAFGQMGCVTRQDRTRRADGSSAASLLAAVTQASVRRAFSSGMRSPVQVTRSELPSPPFAKQP
jgi:hypothetical protein